MSLFSFIIFSVTSGTGLTFLSDRLTLVGASYNGRSRISNGWQVSKAAFLAKCVQNWLFHGILAIVLMMDTEKLLWFSVLIAASTFPVSKIGFFMGFCLHFCFKMEEEFWKLGSSCIRTRLTSGTLKRTMFFVVSIGPLGRGVVSSIQEGWPKFLSVESKK